MGADALSEVLRAVRLSSAMFFSLDVRGPWAAAAPASSECAALVLPGAQRVIQYHVMVEGTCFGAWADAPGVRLDAGDIIAFPQGAAHTLSSAPGMRAVPDLSMYQQAGAGVLPHCVTIGDGDRTDARILCGFMGCDARPFNPLIEALPPVLHLRRSAQPGHCSLPHLISAARAEVEGRRLGGEGVFARLGELLFVEAIRCYVETLDPEQTGWFAGLKDRHVGQVLNLIHADPASDWTLDSLARAAGLCALVARRTIHRFDRTAADAVSGAVADANGGEFADGRARADRTDRRGGGLRFRGGLQPRLSTDGRHAPGILAQTGGRCAGAFGNPPDGVGRAITAWVA